MPSYKLYYFNMMGRAEVIRLIFAQAGVAYEDVRFDQTEWASKYKKMMPYGQVPVLEEDGRMLAQSTAIALYLAKKFELLGSNEWDAAKITEIFCACEDLVSHAVSWIRCEDEVKKKELMAVFERNHLIPACNKFEEMLKSNGNGYFVADKISAADLIILCMVGLFGSIFPNSVENLTHLARFRERMMNMPNIKKWIETRPKTSL